MAGRHRRPSSLPQQFVRYGKHSDTDRKGRILLYNVCFVENEVTLDTQVTAVPYTVDISTA